jgi:peptidoglycan/xylan/chitin deacetylase (PgdA/CDA1 family)
MSEDEIKKWMNGGMEIGAHTQNHIHLSNCDIEVAKTEKVDEILIFSS